MLGRRVVTDPEGARWRVRRRWLMAPIRPRYRGADASNFDLPGGGFDAADGVLGAIVAVIAIIVLAAFVAFVVIPLALLLVEVLIFLVLAGAGLAGRVLLRRPWTLEARRLGASTRMTWSVAGWRDSREALDEIAAALQAGRPVALSAAAWSGAPGSR